MKRLSGVYFMLVHMLAMQLLPLKTGSRMIRATCTLPCMRICRCGHYQLLECVVYNMCVATHMHKQNKDTPLHFASRWGRAAAIEVLVSYQKFVRSARLRDCMTSPNEHMPIESSNEKLGRNSTRTLVVLSAHAHIVSCAHNLYCHTYCYRSA